MITKMLIQLSPFCLFTLLAWGGFYTPLPIQPPADALVQAQATALVANNAISKTLTLRYWLAPSMANPYLQIGIPDRDAGAPVLEPLASYDEAGQLLPRLAVTLPLTTNGGLAADGSAITWTLQSDVRWSDNTPLTAADVRFTWAYCTDPATACAAADHFENVADVTVVNELSVRITFTAPETYPYLPFVSADLPILQRAQFAECVGSAARTCEEENRSPVGTGPFRITAFLVGDTVTYERNPYYRGITPYFDKVVLKGGGDASAVARAVLETGEADYGWNLQVQPHILEELESRGRGRLVAAFATIVERLMINQTNPKPSQLADRSVWRADGSNDHPFLTEPALVQALSLAIDRQQIAELLYGRSAKPTCNLIPGPTALASQQNDECLTQDLTAANRILDELGWVDSNDDGTRDKDGQELEILYQSAASGIRSTTQNLIKQWWTQIGVAAELRVIDAAVFFGSDPQSPDTYQKFYADVEMYSDGARTVDPEAYLGEWQCSQIPLPPTFLSGMNIARWCNHLYDEKYTRLSNTFDPQRRATLVMELNDLIVQQGGMIPLVQRGNLSAHAHHLLGVKMNGWDSELWNIGEWANVEFTHFVYLPVINH